MREQNEQRTTNNEFRTMQLKKMPQNDLSKSLKRLTWAAVAFIFAMIIIAFADKKGNRAVSSVAVAITPLGEGNLLINEADVLEAIEQNYGFVLEGTPIAELEVGRLEQMIETDPFVADADVFVDAEGRVQVEIVQREPVLRIISNNGQNYYLDRDGFKMPLSDHFSARVLVATGNIPPFSDDFMDPEKKHTLKDLFLLRGDLLADAFMNALIEQVYVSNRGEYILIPKLGDQKIILGPYENIVDKFKRLKVFYKEGMPYEGWQKYSEINLKYKGQVVCRKR